MIKQKCKKEKQLKLDKHKNSKINQVEQQQQQIKKTHSLNETLSIENNSNRNENIKISNDSMYNIVSFYRTFIDNFVNVFPNIILNKVNYDNTSIPNYYNFSKFHSNKLIKYISDYFSSLKKFNS